MKGSLKIVRSAWQLLENEFDKKALSDRIKDKKPNKYEN